MHATPQNTQEWIDGKLKSDILKSFGIHVVDEAHYVQQMDFGQLINSTFHAMFPLQGPNIKTIQCSNSSAALISSKKKGH